MHKVKKLIGKIFGKNGKNSSFLTRLNIFSITGQNNHIYLIKQSGEKVAIDAPLPGLDITIRGNNNLLIFKEPLHFQYSSCLIESNDSKINFGSCHPFGVICHIGIRFGDKQSLTFGDNISINNSYFNLGESETKLTFGNDCMISCDCHFFSTDSHHILTGNERKNLQKPSGGIFGSHIWFGAKSLYTKNSSVGDNSVVALGSVVTGQFLNNILIAGNPAKIVRKNISWER